MISGRDLLTRTSCCDAASVAAAASIQMSPSDCSTAFFPPGLLSRPFSSVITLVAKVIHSGLEIESNRLDGESFERIEANTGRRLRQPEHRCQQPAHLWKETPDRREREWPMRQRVRAQAHVARAEADSVATPKERLRREGGADVTRRGRHLSIRFPGDD